MTGRSWTGRPHRRVRLVAGGAIVLAGLAALPPAGDPELRYVANAGMLITVGGRRFLVDAPIRDGIAP
jgi:hypothetical protein